jgi:hypothetical protein
VNKHYLMPEPENDDDYSFTGALTDYPEEWLELSRDGSTRLRSNRRPHAAQELIIDWTGTTGTTGRRAWFLPGKFRFCPACGDQPAVSVAPRELYLHARTARHRQRH